MKNGIRTSESVASLAAEVLAQGVERLRLKHEMEEILTNLYLDEFLDDIARTLAGSALSNRRE